MARLSADAFHQPTEALPGDVIYAIGTRNAQKIDMSMSMQVLGTYVATLVGTGKDAFSPLLRIAVDGNRRVWELYDWVGPAGGTKPTLRGYLGSAGIVSDIAAATDVRGAQGAPGDVTSVQGWSPVYAVEIAGAKAVLKVTGWTGGTGTAPAVGVYLGPTGYVATAAEATDIRGPTGAASLTAAGVLGGRAAGAAGTLALGRRLGLLTGSDTLRVQAPLPTGPLRVIYCGDAAGIGIGTNTTATTYNGQHMASWLAFLLRRRFRYDITADRYGANAAPTTYFINASTLAPLAPLTAALAADADLVLLDVGTFDLAAGTPAATIAARIAAIVALFLAAGTQVLMIGPRPYVSWNADATLAALYQRTAQQLGVLLSRAARATPGTAYIDTWRALVDPATGTPRTGLVGVDGVSSPYLGSAAQALLAAQAARLLAPAVSGLQEPMLAWGAADAWHADYPAGNLLGSGGVFTGNSGSLGAGITGELAAGWTVASSVSAANVSGTITASRVASAEGFRQRFVMAGRQATTAAETIVLRSPAVDFSGGSYAAGDVLVAALNVLTTGLSPARGVLAKLVEAAGDGNASYERVDDRTTSTGGDLSGSEGGILMTPPLTVRAPAATGTRTLQVEIRFALGNLGTPCNGEISFDAVAVRKQ